MPIPFLTPIQFSGQISQIFGPSGQVPDAVRKAVRSVQAVVSQQTSGDYTATNAFCLKDDQFVSVSHGIHQPNKPDTTLMGTYTVTPHDGMNATVSDTRIIQNNPGQDLALLKTLSALPSQKPAKPLPLAQHEPGKYEDVFIVGYHKELGGPNIFQGRYLGPVKRHFSGNSFFGKQAGISGINIPAFDRVSPGYCGQHPESISGSPVLNRQGEVTGIVKAAGYDETDQPTGFFHIINLGTLRQFARNNEQSAHTPTPEAA